MSDGENTVALAEQYLDEMLAAEATGDYEGFVQRFEKKDLVDFGPSRFRKEMFSESEDLGRFQRREYLGSLKGFIDKDDPDRYPGCVRYVWRGIYEKNEAILTVGVHEKDGVLHVNEFMSR